MPSQQSKGMESSNYTGYMKGQTRTQSLFMCFGGERRLGVRLRHVQGLMGRDEGKIAIAHLQRTKSASPYFSFIPSHETPHAPQPNPQSSLTPKNT